MIMMIMMMMMMMMMEAVLVVRECLESMSAMFRGTTAALALNMMSTSVVYLTYTHCCDEDMHNCCKKDRIHHAQSFIEMSA